MAGKGVDDGDADTMQAARVLVRVLIELAAGVQLGHDDLHRGTSLGGLHGDRNAAAVVGHRNRSVGVTGDGDRVAVSGERLVEGVVNHLLDYEMQAGTVLRVAEINP